MALTIAPVFPLHAQVVAVFVPFTVPRRRRVRRTIVLHRTTGSVHENWLWKGQILTLDYSELNQISSLTHLALGILQQTLRLDALLVT